VWGLSPKNGGIGKRYQKRPGRISIIEQHVEKKRAIGNLEE
jgi:hypothetical protein